METKQELRDRMKQARAALSRKEIIERSLYAIEQIQQDFRFINAKTVAIYYPFAHEVDLLNLTKNDKRFALPKVNGSEMNFIEFKADSTLSRSPIGIYEPIDGTCLDGQIDLMLVPALVVDKDYYRVGHGKGYYDRYLSKYRPRHVIAVIYDFQFVKAFHHREHDIPLDDVIIV